MPPRNSIVAVKVHTPSEIIEVPIDRVLPDGIRLVGPQGEPAVVAFWHKDQVGRRFTQYVGFPLELVQEVSAIERPA